jgi:predicted HicB family RNase H-like nuclease
MMNVLEYKGFKARIELDPDDECFVGHIAGINDIVGFHGTSVREIKSAFREAVDDYLVC